MATGRGLGFTQQNGTGRNVMVAADMDLDFLARGATIDWTTVAAAGADGTVSLDDTPYKLGEYYLRLGQVMCRIGTAEVQTFTWTGGPTSGGAVLHYPATSLWDAMVTTAIPFNATAAEFQAALVALQRFADGRVLVTRAGAGTNGSPYVYTVTYDPVLGNVDQPTATHNFLGGTSPTATPATSTQGAGSNKFGPYDPAQTDGRQLLNRGDCFILNRTVLEKEYMSMYPQGGGITGGLLFKKRVLMTTGTHSLAAGPTVAEVEAAFPDVDWAS